MSADKQWLPGDLVVVVHGALVEKLGSNAVHWSSGQQVGMVVSGPNEVGSVTRHGMIAVRCHVVLYRPLARPRALDNVVGIGLYLVPVGCLSTAEDVQEPHGSPTLAHE